MLWMQPFKLTFDPAGVVLTLDMAIQLTFDPSGVIPGDHSVYVGAQRAIDTDADCQDLQPTGVVLVDFN